MTSNESLAKYLDSLPAPERIAKSRDIREKLNISKDKLSDWRCGRIKLDYLSFCKLKKILGVELESDFDI